MSLCMRESGNFLVVMVSIQRPGGEYCMKLNTFRQINLRRVVCVTTFLIFARYSWQMLGIAGILRCLSVIFCLELNFNLVSWVMLICVLFVSQQLIICKQRLHVQETMGFCYYGFRF